MNVPHFECGARNARLARPAGATYSVQAEAATLLALGWRLSEPIFDLFGGEREFDPIRVVHEHVGGDCNLVRPDAKRLFDLGNQERLAVIVRKSGDHANPSTV